MNNKSSILFISISILFLFFLSSYANAISVNAHEINPVLQYDYSGDMLGGNKVNIQNRVVAVNNSGVLSLYYISGNSLYKYTGGASQTFFTHNYTDAGGSYPYSRCKLNAFAINNDYIYVVGSFTHKYDATNQLYECYLTLYKISLTTGVVTSHNTSRITFGTTTIHEIRDYSVGVTIDNSNNNNILISYIEENGDGIYIADWKVGISVSIIGTGYSEAQPTYSFPFIIREYNGSGFILISSAYIYYATVETTGNTAYCTKVTNNHLFDLTYPIRIVDDTLVSTDTLVISGRVTLEGAPYSGEGGMRFINFYVSNSLPSFETPMPYTITGYENLGTWGCLWTYHVGEYSITMAMYRFVGGIGNDFLFTVTLTFDSQNRISTFATPINMQSEIVDYPISNLAIWGYEIATYSSDYETGWFYNNGYGLGTSGNLRIEYAPNPVASTKIYTIEGSPVTSQIPSGGEFSLGGLFYGSNITLLPNYIYYAKQPFLNAPPLIISEISTIVLANSTNNQIFTFLIWNDDTLIYSQNCTLTTNTTVSFTEYPNVIASNSVMTIRYGIRVYENMTIGTDYRNSHLSYQKAIINGTTFSWYVSDWFGYHQEDGTPLNDRIAMRIKYFFNQTGLTPVIDNNTGGVTVINGSLTYVPPTIIIDVNGSSIVQPTTPIGSYLGTISQQVGLGFALNYIVWFAIGISIIVVFAKFNVLYPVVVMFVILGDTAVCFMLGIIDITLFIGVLLVLAGFGSLKVVQKISPNNTSE